MGPEIFVVGSLNMDLVIEAERLPRAGETLSGGDVAFFPGGKGANQACAAAQLGAVTRMVGQVGNDGFGPQLVESLTNSKVDCSLVGVDHRPTGTALIVVLPDGENSILISPGANQSVLPELAMRRLERLDSDSLLLLQLEIPLETVFATARLASDRGARVILDPAPVRTLPPELLRSLSILTPNQTEAAQLLRWSGDRIGTVDQARDAARELRRLGPRTVIVKLGSLGCYICSPEMERHVPGFAVEAVDTTAAGDTFNGALAAALAEGMTLLESARFANAAAALSVTRRGAQSSIPSRGETDAMIAG